MSTQSPHPHQLRLELRQLAEHVLATMAAQQAFFDKKRRGLNSQDELEAAKIAERQMRSRCRAILAEPTSVTPSLFGEEG